MMKICELKNISKSYTSKRILNDIHLEVYEKEMVAITGNSGAGKSTLLNIIGLLEKADKGNIVMFGEDVTNINKSNLNKLLRKKISYLFQNYALIDNESIDKNLEIALVYSEKNKEEKQNMKKSVLERVGINLPLKTKIYELSGGEQQRVAIARILLKPCDLIIADEPTGSLDRYNRDEIVRILKEINKDGKTLIIVTHDEYVAKQCDRIIKIEDGEIK